MAAGGAIRLPAAALPDAATEIGIRPEDLRLRPFVDDGRLPASIFEVEPLGGFTVVTLEAGGQKLRALLRGQASFGVDDKMLIEVEPRSVLGFSPDGRTVSA